MFCNLVFVDPFSFACIWNYFFCLLIKKKTHITPVKYNLSLDNPQTIS